MRDWIPNCAPCATDGCWGRRGISPCLQPQLLIWLRRWARVLGPCLGAIPRASVYTGEARLQAWTDQLIHRLALPSCFVLLPASSSIGSYKNPEVVLEALSSHALHSVHLLLTGVAAQRHAERYRECYPHLRDRIHVHALNDLELQCLYRKALAVVVPSRREGFGLPVLEAMASGGRVLTMDVAGLREAASGAVPCLDPEDAHLLRLWLELLLDAPSQAWLMPHLARRRRARLERLDPDLLGLTLLAQARRLANRQSR